MSLLSLCDQTADIERATTAAASSSNLGGHVPTWSVVYNDIPVSMPQQPSGGTRVEMMRRNLIVSHTFYCPQAVTVQTGDRLVYGGLNYLVQWASDEGGRGRLTAIHTLLKS